LEEEERDRKQRELDAIKKKNDEEALKRKMTAVGLDTSVVDNGSYNREDLDQAMREKALKQRENEMRQRTDQARKLDYLVRALRLLEKEKAIAAQKQRLEEDIRYVKERNELEYVLFYLYNI
jgi:hypothetical protein